MKTKHLITRRNGVAEWTHQKGDLYLATGILRSGKRMGTITGNSWFHISRINLWCGSKWLLRNGKRYLICRVIN